MGVETERQQLDDAGVSSAKLADVLKKNTLPFIGGDVAGVVGKEAAFSPYISLHPGEETMNVFDKGKVNALFVKGMGAVLATNGLAKENYLEGIGGRDFQHIPSVVATLSNEAVRGEQQSKQVVMRLIFGASEQMSLRSLGSYAATLSYIDSIRRSGIAVPQLQLIFPHHFSTSLNGRNPEKVQAEIAQFALVARAYEKTFFPELSGTTLFLEDKRQEEYPQYYAGITALSTYLQKNISEGLRERLMSRGHEEAEEDKKFTYGAAHAYFHDTTAEQTLRPLSFVSDQSEMVIPTTVINAGGYQEQDFYDVRFETRDALADPLQTVQLFNRFRVPPYEMARGIDISLTQAIDDPSIRHTVPKDARAVKKDLVYLDEVSAKRGDLNKFLEEMRGIAA